MADGVEIDTEQVDDFGRGMRAQAGEGFASAAKRGADLHSFGVVFGAGLPGEAILAAKTRYAQALENTDANLRAYEAAAEILAEVAEQVARDFSTADMSSVVAQRKVESLLSGAIDRANKVLGVTGGGG